MENKEFQFKGTTLSGFAMLFANIMLTLLSVALLVLGFTRNQYEVLTGVIIGFGFALFIATIFLWAGFVMLEPGEARVMMFFGKYKGTFTKVGYSWVNPFINTKKLSLRARNLDAEPIKVKVGDKKNIEETLPYLLPQQQEDVPGCRAYQGERQDGQPGDDWPGARVETEGHLQGYV